MKRATPENRRLAELIDQLDRLDELDDAALREVREQAAADAVAPSGGSSTVPRSLARSS